MRQSNGNLFWAATLFAASGVIALAADASAPAPALAETSGSAPAASSGLKQDKYTNGVIAVVNGKIITLNDLDKERKPLMDRFEASLEGKYPDTLEGHKAWGVEMAKEGDELGAEILHSLVDRMLIVEDFRTKGGTFPQSALDSQFDDSITMRFKGDREEFLRYLNANEMTEADYRRQLEEDDIVQVLTQQQHKSVTGISPDRIKAYYEKKKQDFFVKESVRVRQITLDLKPVADETPELIQQLAVKIVQDARQPGANFSDLAKRYSIDSTVRDGELPANTYYRDDKTLPAQLQEAVFKLQSGEVSDPVTNDHFIFIFKCEDHTPEGYLPLEKVRSNIEKALVDQDDQQATEKWLQKLRSKAFIQYNIYGPEPTGK